MQRTIVLALGAPACATWQATGAAAQTQTGSEQGVIAIIKPGATGTLPYIEKRKTAKKLNPRMQNPPEPDKTRGVWNPGDKGDPGIGDPEDMPTWAREALSRRSCALHSGLRGAPSAASRAHACRRQ